jgi:uncharacterized RDD family membrane protein YckC
MIATRGNDEIIYYDKCDYASIFYRVLVAIIDLSIIGIVGYMLSTIWTYWADPPDFDLISEFGWLSAAFFSPEYFWTVTSISYVYLSIIKKSHLKTIGYRILHLKIIDAQGNAPSLLKMSWRFLLLIFGPFHLFIDLLWLGGDNYRQTLRDKLAGTYVIKANAKPAGKGTLVFERYNLLGLSLIFQEIKAEKEN